MGMLLKLLVAAVILGCCHAETEQELLDQIYGYLEMVHFPDEQEGIKDAAATYAEETKVLQEIFKTYNNEQVPKNEDKSALSIGTAFSIEHIEPLDESEETMTVHGSMTLKWQDPGFKWDPEAHGQIKTITRSFNDYTPFLRVWTPVLNFKSAVPSESRRQDGVESMSTILSINYDGSVAMQRKFTVKAPCDFIFEDFPYDKQSCKLMLTSAYTLKQVWFEYDDNESRHVVRQKRRGQTAPTIGEFTLEWIDVHQGVIGTDIRKDSVTHRYKAGDTPSYRDTIRMALYVDMVFERINERYFFLFNLPLVTVVLMAQGAALCNTKKAYFTLALSYFLFMNQFGLITDKFPSNADGTPVIAYMYFIAFAHLLMCTIGITVITFLYGSREGLVFSYKPTPAHYFLDEFWARAVYFFITGTTMAVILYGTLYLQSWRHWDPMNDVPRN